MPEFAIGIPTINRWDLLKFSLQNYLTNDFKNIKIFILDNGKQNIDIIHTNLTIFEVNYNIGVAGSWNILCQAIFAEHDNALILNDDIYLGRNQNEINNLLEESDPPQKNIDFWAAPPCWCSFILPYKTMQQIGLFDTHYYPCYHEDNDYRYRMGLAGMNIVQTEILSPKIFRKSMSVLKDPSLDKNFLKNQQYHIRKWGGMPDHEVFKTPFDL